MNGFSFREYLEFKLKKQFPRCTLRDLVTKGSKYAKDISKTPKLLGHFKEYIADGYYPIFTELKTVAAFRDAIMAIVDKTIFEDIGNFYSLKTGNLETLRRLIYFVATIPPGTLNINKLAKSLKKDHATIADYLEMLRESGLMRFLLSDKQGHALVRRAEKLYLNNTNLLYAVCTNIGKDVDTGTMRELFVISQLEQAGYNAFYSSDGDIACDTYIFEIGGRGKGRGQVAHRKNAHLIKDGILLGEKKEIPLYLFGFLS